ncbi:hypothetical protein QJS04_geneDACA023751 [Acorus gramineus]|uniref:Uncharacterized protein n=1 Tax=Acorus gramineus TaxID=55184 RepID=A0AAV9BNV4_ACOGR|nr:hypothetical protein QJS04_geneDACA023751 [Acorus gramineus]
MVRMMVNGGGRIGDFGWFMVDSDDDDDGEGGHICQCLGRLWSLRRSSVVTVSEERPGRTGGRFVEDVLGLARGLSEHGLRGGDVVAVAALNRFSDNNPLQNV